MYILLLSTLLYVCTYPSKVARRYDPTEAEKWVKAEEDVFKGLNMYINKDLIGH